MSARKEAPNPSLKIEPLARKHDRTAFSCGQEALDRYIRERASQEARKHIAMSFVLVEANAPHVLGYYSLSATSIQLVNLPEATAKRLPRYPHLPATRLGRLAIDTRYQGRGYGEMLLMDALRRAFQATAEVASFAVVVDAKDDPARAFYQHYGFLALPDQPLRLFLPMKTISGLFV